MRPNTRIPLYSHAYVLVTGELPCDDNMLPTLLAKLFYAQVCFLLLSIASTLHSFYNVALHTQHGVGIDRLPEFIGLFNFMYAP